MSDHITGIEARELLDGITGGQWFCYHDMDADEGEPVSTIQAEYPDSDIASVADGDGVRNPADGRLLARAPDLAETVAWLYGREAGDYGYQFVSGDEYVFAKPDGSVVHIDNDPDWEPKRYMSPDEAVDLARALLAAAEEARKETP